MAVIRVLIVDDSVVVRRLLTEALRLDPAIDVVGTAADGSIGLTKIPMLNPDLVTLDVEMPGMSGLETLAAIRKAYPRLPVIMFSTLTERGAATTLEALSLGASDYASKPQNTGSLEQTRAYIQAELIPKIKALGKRERRPSVPPGRPEGIKPPMSAVAASKLPIAPDRVDVVAVGTSTGGPNALAAILPKIPGDFPVPVVVVVSCADFITLLFAFFVVLYSSSQVDKRKVGRLALAIQVAFQELGVFDTSNTKIPLSSSEPMPFSTIQAVENIDRSGDMQRFVQPTKGVLGPSATSGSLKDIQEELQKALAPEIKDRYVDVQMRKEGVIVTLREMGFYDRGSATMRPSVMNAVGSSFGGHQRRGTGPRAERRR